MTDSLSRILRPLASLRLTVVLLALLMVLVFAGTWAQIDMGIWSTLQTYFRSSSESSTEQDTNATN